MASDSAVWVVATGNAGKRVEFEQILASSGIEIRNLRGFGDVSFPEEGTDYRENAIEKARAAASQIGEIAVADDSGIEVTALDGRPGPLSARYGGEGLDDKGRSARFVCYAALSTPEGDTVVSYGECTGLILPAPAGEGGFGYDPVFKPDGYDVSMAQIDLKAKNAISHRARALHDLLARWSGIENTPDPSGRPGR
jgi:XTP/dITP diphosphohydrolase